MVELGPCGGRLEWMIDVMAMNAEGKIDRSIRKVRKGVASRRGALRKARALEKQYPGKVVWVCEREVGRWGWDAYSVDKFEEALDA